MKSLRVIVRRQGPGEEKPGFFEARVEQHGRLGSDLLKHRIKDKDKAIERADKEILKEYRGGKYVAIEPPEITYDVQDPTPPQAV